jgi:hypothetical protein
MKQSKLDFANFVRDLAVDALKPDQQAAFINQVMEIVHNRVRVRLSASLTEEEERRLEGAEKQGGPDAVLDELEKIRPHFGDLYQEELDRLHKEMLQAMFPQHKDGSATSRRKRAKRG